MWTYRSLERKELGCKAKHMAMCTRQDMAMCTQARGSVFRSKKKELGSYVHEQAKGAHIRVQTSNVKEIDDPTSYFFNLEQRTRPHNLMLHLKHPVQTTTTTPAE